MNLPTEEQNVLNVLIAAKGSPLRVVEISEKLGIQHNHCSKLIKFLTDKSIPIERDFVVIDGKKKSYKSYWLGSKDLALPLVQVSWPCPICGSYYRRGSDCNICIKEELSA